MKLTNGVTA